MANLFVTSDQKFIINIDKIILIDSNEYWQNTITINGCDDKGFLKVNNPNYVSTQMPTTTNPQYFEAQVFPNNGLIESSFYHVYLEGLENPIKLTYKDGINLIQKLITLNTISVNNNADIAKENGIFGTTDIKYNTVKYMTNVPIITQESNSLNIKYIKYFVVS